MCFFKLIKMHLLVSELYIEVVVWSAHQWPNEMNVWIVAIVVAVAFCRNIHWLCVIGFKEKLTANLIWTDSDWTWTLLPTYGLQRKRETKFFRRCLWRQNRALDGGVVAPCNLLLLIFCSYYLLTATAAADYDDDDDDDDANVTVIAV